MQLIAFHSDPVCSIHITHAEEGDRITLFKDENLHTCKEVLAHRKKYNLKHSHLELPEDVDGKHGFHIGCYRKFVALSKKHRAIMAENSSKRETPKKREKKNCQLIVLHVQLSLPLSHPELQEFSLNDACFAIDQGKKLMAVSNRLLMLPQIISKQT